MNGWITEVNDGIVWGRVLIHGEEFEFWMPILSVLEDQRVELEPCRYCSIVNGHLLIDKTIWTTHDVENADQAAHKLYRDLGWGGEASGLSDDRTAVDQQPGGSVNQRISP